jgi:hypothetical protein
MGALRHETMRRAIGRRQVLATLGGTAVGGTVLATAGSVPAAAQDDTDDEGLERPLAWANGYGGSRYTVISSVVPAQGEGYLVGGRQASDSDETSAWLGRADADGQLQWDRRYRGGVRGTVETVVTNGDGTYLVAGGRVEGETTGGWAATVSSSGDIQWERSYDDATKILSAAQTGDGYLLLGRREAGIWTAAVDEDGSVDSDRTSNDSLAFTIRPAGDGTFLLCGVQYTAEGAPNPWVASLAGTNRMRWDRAYETNAVPNQVVPADDGAYLVGYSAGGETEATDGWMAKIGSPGEVGWEHRYDRNQRDILFSLAPTDDGAILGGWSGTGSTGDAWLVAVDEAGDQRWEQIYDTDGWSRFNDLLGTDDGVIVAGGNGGSALLGLYDPSAESDSQSAPTATPAATTTATADGTAPTDRARTMGASGETAREDRTTTAAQAEEPGATTTSGSGPGLGIASALAGVGSAAALLRRNRRDEN